MSTGQGMALGTPAWLTWASAAVSLGASAARFPTAWPEGCPPDTLARWFLPTLALQMGSVIPRPLHLPPSSLKSCSLAHLPTRRGCRARVRSVVWRVSRACADAPRAAGTETLVRQLLTNCLLLIGGSPTDTRVVWCTHVDPERPTGSTYKVLAKAWQGSNEAGEAGSC